MKKMRDKIFGLCAVTFLVSLSLWWAVDLTRAELLQVRNGKMVLRNGKMGMETPPPPPDPRLWDTYSNYLALAYDFEMPVNSSGKIIDVAPGGNATGTLNGATWGTNVSPRAGSGYDFDGGDDYIKVINSIMPSVTSVIISAWIRAETFEDYDAIFACFQNVSPYAIPGVYVRMNGVGGVVSILHGAAATDSSGSALVLNTWIHFAISWDKGDGGYSHVYTNGVNILVSPAADSGNVDDSTYRLALMYAGGVLGRFVDGQMDCVRVYTNLSVNQGTGYPNGYHPIISNIWWNTQGGTNEIGWTTSWNPPQAHNLVAWWINNQTSNDAVTGIYPDTSGSANHGSQASAVCRPAWDSSVGGCLDFDGVNDWVDLTLWPPDARMCVTGSTTRAAWFLQDEDSAEANLSLFSSRDAPDANGVDWLVSTPNKHVLVINRKTSDAGSTVLNSVTNGLWYHTAWTYDQSTGIHVLYLNGLAAHTWTNLWDTLTVNTKCEPLFAAMFVSGMEYFWHGKMSDMMIYNTALSAAEVLDLKTGTAKGR